MSGWAMYVDDSLDGVAMVRACCANNHLRY